jgi:CTP synthase (UTP-ammonia lyase)
VPLVEQNEEITLHGGLVQKAYGVSQITEAYHCSYGLNREYESVLVKNGLHATAHALSSGEVRAIELSAHPFFVATLFQSERRALRDEIPPLVKAFVNSLAR